MAWNFFFKFGAERYAKDDELEVCVILFNQLGFSCVIIITSTPTLRNSDVIWFESNSSFSNFHQYYLSWMHTKYFSYYKYFPQEFFFKCHAFWRFYRRLAANHKTSSRFRFGKMHRNGWIFFSFGGDVTKMQLSKNRNKSDQSKQIVLYRYLKTDFGTYRIVATLSGIVWAVMAKHAVLNAEAPRASMHLTTKHITMKVVLSSMRSRILKT